MKKYIYIILLCTLCCLSANAGTDSYQFKSGDFFCNVLNESAKTVEIVNNPYHDDGYYQEKTSYEIPSTVEYNGNTYTVTSIKDECFKYAGSKKDTTTFILPNTLTNVGKDAFYSNYIKSSTGLFKVNIPSSLVTIGESAFNYVCITNREDVVLPNVETIAPSAFLGSDIKKISFTGSGLTMLPEQCFMTCRNLKTIYIPASVTSIGTNCFYKCSALTEIRNAASAPQSLGGNVFKITSTTSVWQNAGAKLIVKDETVRAAFAAAETWRNFTIEVGDVTGISNVVVPEINQPTVLKYFENGKVIITKNGKRYTASGIEISR